MARTREPGPTWAPVLASLGARRAENKHAGAAGSPRHPTAAAAMTRRSVLLTFQVARLIVRHAARSTAGRPRELRKSVVA